MTLQPKSFNFAGFSSPVHSKLIVFPQSLKNVKHLTLELNEKECVQLHNDVCSSCGFPSYTKQLSFNNIAEM